jgi:hypothetical protein
VIDIAIVIAACGGGVSLTDTQKVWCASHDMTKLAVVGNGDDLVLRAADKLGMTIPPEVVQANAISLDVAVGGLREGRPPPAVWLPQTRVTPGAATQP